MTLITVEMALERVLAGAETLGVEIVPVAEAGRRVLAADAAARVTQPPFDASAMDGYAVRASGVQAVPARLTVIGTSAAGKAFAGATGERQAVRIFTGAPMPQGADAVVIQEDTVRPDGGTVEILQSPRLGQHIRLRGYDFKSGDILLRKGLRLKSRHLMLAASMNHGELSVARKPSIAIVPTGDELVIPGETPGADQIVSSVPAGLYAAATAWGAAATVLPIAADTRASLAGSIAGASEADILVTIGGASAGDHDLVRAAFEGAGAAFDVLKIAMRPGKPVMFGKRGQQRILCLPGNPISALICARVLLKPLIEALLGLDGGRVQESLPLAMPIEANGDRQHYVRGQIAGGAVTPILDQDSSLTRAFAAADCLIVRPPRAPALAAGAPVPVVLLDF